ncbi:MAG: 16S rRNA (guanine(527)-N(7))-methyltransferase RsmG [Betaproteobacteria bacterium]
MNAGEVLARGLAELRLDLPEEALAQLMRYVALLEKWNKVYNLTAVRGTAEIVTHHLLDSLAVLPYIDARSMVDVGSGAGLPGIPFALAQPRTEVTLLDASQKRAAFLRQAVIELGIGNAEVVCARVEEWRAPALFEAVVSRAFADLTKFVALAARLCAPHGILAAMKGAYAESELRELPGGFALKRAVPIKVPGLNAARHLVLLQPKAAAA